MGEHPAFLKMAHAAEAFYTFRRMGMGGTSRTTGHFFGSVVLFDEFQQYQNQDYDVSFFTANAKLSPQSMLVAFTVTATHEPGREIRLSDGGKANTTELSRIQQALRELPAVEVLRLDDPPKRTAMIPHAKLVGWVNDQEILLVENGLLVSYNVASGRRRKSEIKVFKESYAFLR